MKSVLNFVANYKAVFVRMYDEHWTIITLMNLMITIIKILFYCYRHYCVEI